MLMRIRCVITVGSGGIYSASARPLSVSKAGAMSSARRISSVKTSRPSVRAVASTSSLSSVLGIAHIDQHGHSAKNGYQLAKKFQALASKIGLLCREAADVAARFSKACDETVSHRVPSQCKDNRDNRCRLLDRNGGWCSRRDNDIDLEPGELGGYLCEPIGSSASPAIVDRNGATLNPIEFAQSLYETGNPMPPSRRRGRSKKSDGRQFARLLRTRRERPRRRAAEQR